MDVSHQLYLERDERLLYQDFIIYSSNLYKNLV
jgi:hypothetical protein